VGRRGRRRRAHGVIRDQLGEPREVLRATGDFDRRADDPADHAAQEAVRFEHDVGASATPAQLRATDGPDRASRAVAAVTSERETLEVVLAEGQRHGLGEEIEVKAKWNQPGPERRPRR
jgi:hypothetical protein